MSSYKDSLSAFLARNENRESELAQLVGRTQATINRYRNGRRFPDADTARLIEQHTGGEVSFAIWQTDFLRRSGIVSERAA